MRGRTQMIAGAIAVSMLAIGCGDDVTGPAMDQNKPGTGTSDMLVDAEITGREASGGVVTDFNVQIQDEQGAAVSEATVTIQNSELGTVTLLEENAGSGEYVAQRNQFSSGGYELKIVKDSSRVQGVVVGGIGPHTITSPTANDTVAANRALKITWDRPAEAAGTDIETRDFEVDGISDSGSYEIPADKNQARAEQRVRVTRYNKVDIAGGLYGSTMMIRLRVEEEPIVVVQQ